MGSFGLWVTEQQVKWSGYVTPAMLSPVAVVWQVLL
ncbi:MAG: hypothetical protein UY33_C0028G0014 [Candidatus Amesbacteria bacterium GW2011_GWA1_48_9]|uniref:Uncharacterized protein n=2 Tax=Candidatus Amesiibacteriota TaxID=1752730 RepID=A0A0G1UI19_9BACT|nr:MAG: hypothetical protein UY22_C0017G0023 [Candidatus Amesbacteria bacterium GW2011_GWC1_48_10]KKU99560.1 MAG: hypothetical protein UY33_C0028G0014 [Candidatus Amesbacteria bacterium GW2011_GWA1_48_9]